MDINRIIEKILKKYPRFGAIIAKVKFEERTNIATAGTNGKTIIYNPEFLSNLSEKQQIFVIVHEICHIAFQHILRSKGKENIAWNKATDAVINALLKEDGLELTDEAIDIPEAINYSAEEMYYQFLEESKNKEKEQNTSKKIGRKGHDTHEFWDETIENSNIDVDVEFDEISEFKKNILDRRKKRQNQRKKLAEKSTGNKGVSNSKIFQNIGVEESYVDWTSLLKGMSKQNLRYSYRNAKIENGIVKPGIERINIPLTEIMLDTSGSINSRTFKSLLRQCKNIFNDSKIRVGCFDKRFYGFYDIENVEDIEKIRYNIGGGTDFEVAIKSFSNSADNKIIFTDGYSEMPYTIEDVIWVVCGDKKIEPKGGKVIYVKKELLNLLNNDDIERCI